MQVAEYLCPHRVEVTSAEAAAEAGRVVGRLVSIRYVNYGPDILVRADGSVEALIPGGHEVVNEFWRTMGETWCAPDLAAVFAVAAQRETMQQARYDLRKLDEYPLPAGGAGQPGLPGIILMIWEGGLVSLTLYGTIAPLAAVYGTLAALLVFVGYWLGWVLRR
jgi:hypothetical protein